MKKKLFISSEMLNSGLFSKTPVSGVYLKQLSETLCKNIVKLKVKTIQEAITDYEQREGCYAPHRSPLKDRIAKMVFPDKSEIYAFDGVDLIKFFPIKFGEEKKLGGILMKATQFYKILYK